MADHYTEEKLADPVEIETISEKGNDPRMKVSWYPATIIGESEGGEYELDMLIMSGTVGMVPNSLR